MALAIDSAAFFARLEKNHQPSETSAISPTAIIDHFTIGRERSLTHVEVAIYCSINGSRFRLCAEARPFANVVTPCSKMWNLEEKEKIAAWLRGCQAGARVKIPICHRSLVVGHLPRGDDRRFGHSGRPEKSASHIFCPTFFCPGFAYRKICDKWPITNDDFYSRCLVVCSVTLDGLTSSDVVGAESAGDCAEN